MPSETNPEPPDIPKPSGAPADVGISGEIGAAGAEEELIRLSYSSVFHFSGPLPPPRILGEYETAYPGAAAVILKMAQAEQKNRWDDRNQVNRIVRWRSMTGLSAGLFVASLFVVCGTYCVIQGHDWAGTLICSGTLLGLVGLFVRGQADTDAGENEKVPPEVKRKSAP